MNVSTDGAAQFFRSSDLSTLLIDPYSSNGIGGNISIEKSEREIAAEKRQKFISELLGVDKNSILKAKIGDDLLRSLGLQSDFGASLMKANGTYKTLPAFSTEFGRRLGWALSLIALNRAAPRFRRQSFFCSATNNKWDSHSDQLVNHNSLLKELDDSVGAFWNEVLMLGMQNEVTLYTSCEFGRNFAANGAKSTDHGWGNHHFILGGGVRGGVFRGKLPKLEVNGPDSASSGTDGGWIPTTSVDEFGASLAKWFGVSEADMSYVFPNLSRFDNSSYKNGYLDIFKA
jgi:Protein of unknown function (DUF1501)